MLLICDNLAGHKTPDFVVWLCTHGILPLYTSLGASWLNMAESIQRDPLVVFEHESDEAQIRPFA